MDIKKVFDIEEWPKTYMDDGSGKLHDRTPDLSLYDGMMVKKDAPQIFDGRFPDVLMDVLKAASTEFKRHLPEKGDSWREMDMEDLRMLFRDAMKEWEYEYADSGLIVDMINQGKQSEYGQTPEYDQLLDIINLGLMLAQRITMKEDADGKDHVEPNE